ncbi:hypothetical protein L873DRAFT_1819960 [Choiromyces venosus 120613-1]|uniref:Uncharacterized protein n=1 Tax=Choiromyces venosus 120613-1 TaxID=1336337 RepID=A0A3N4J3I2_9PEZI|nr:hypothetical protein L873DRAFT_1819960 [Choiromyces venosus 120613-1]
MENRSSGRLRFSSILMSTVGYPPYVLYSTYHTPPALRVFRVYGISFVGCLPIIIQSPSLLRFREKKV